jgi:hypothetical protein
VLGAPDNASVPLKDEARSDLEAKSRVAPTTKPGRDALADRSSRPAAGRGS